MSDLELTLGASSRLQRATRRSVTRLLPPLFALLCAGCGDEHRTGLELEPGEWEFATSLESPLQAYKDSYRQCMTDAPIGPRAFLEHDEKCEIDIVDMSATRMEWTIACANTGGNMTGTGEMDSNGSTARAVVALSVSAMGEQAIHRREWDARLIGPCR